MNKLNILYEDNHIIVVVKESGILSQSDITRDIDLLSLIKAYVKEKYKKPGNVYIGLVHRLDRMVSGIMVFARTSKAANRLNIQIKNNDLKKSYICLVKGKLEGSGTLKNYLIKDEKGNMSFVTDNKKGKLSVLNYKAIFYDKVKNLSLIDIDLLTGRHHQIRVQLSNIGHPIYGDNKYDKNPTNANIRLHAYKLSFNHPITKERLEFINYPDWAKKN